MTYYILLPNEVESDAMYSSSILGEESFGTFYPDDGMKKLDKIVNEYPAMVDKLRIITDQKKTITILEFFDILEKLKIKKA